MHTEHPDVASTLLHILEESFDPHLFFFSARDPLSSSLLFFENATQKHSSSKQKKFYCISLCAFVVHVCERILALSRVLFSSFGGAVLSHRFFRVVVVAREAAGGRCTSRDDTFCIGSCAIGEKESN